MNGILLVDKPAGWTSHDVVAKLRGVLGERRMGHSGTLDPMATGLLVVFAGRATRAVSFSENHTKCYEAHLRLGLTTDTQDTTGTVLSRSERAVNRAELEAVLPQFRGDILQVPPMYSALKVDGKKLYEIARRGGEVARKARPVTIEELTVLGEADGDYVLRVRCSKGTYIRTLCHDIGARLGCGGTMKSLKRTRVGLFTIDNALRLDELEKLAHEDRLEEQVIPVEAMFAELPSVTIQNPFRRLLENGNAFYPEQIREEREAVDGVRVKVYDMEGRFYGIFAYSDEKGRYQPVKMFL